jgi:hypothetical protein
MRICFLTQTATDISEEYKEFFRDKDLFFVTFKAPNPNALAFAPKSTWSDGRNKLWEMVKDKYDYYVFMDDDLLFYNMSARISKFGLGAYIYYKYYCKGNLPACYKQSTPIEFFYKLEEHLNEFKPEVLSVTQIDCDFHHDMDTLALRKNTFVRRMAHFDAQFTVMSNYAASKLLPYDNRISGWWSSQIPIYLYSYNVFGSKAVSAVDLGVMNRNHVGAYVVNYDGIQDCKKMITKISEATGRDYSELGSLNEEEAINLNYKKDALRKDILPSKMASEDYKSNFQNKLSGLENLITHNMLID